MESINRFEPDYQLSLETPYLHHMEVALKRVTDIPVEVRGITGPDVAYAIIEQAFELSTRTREHFGALYLDAKNQVLAAHILHIGTFNMTNISARDILQPAFLHSASNIILFHNHPSGSTEPSGNDIASTCRLKIACGFVDIHLTDHLVIGHDAYQSLG